MRGPSSVKQGVSGSKPVQCADPRNNNAIRYADSHKYMSVHVIRTFTPSISWLSVCLSLCIPAHATDTSPHNLPYFIQAMLCDLFASLSYVQPRGLKRWAGHVARVVERSGACRDLVGKPEGKRPLGRTSRRWEDKIKIDLQEMGCGS